MDDVKQFFLIKGDDPTLIAAELRSLVASILGDVQSDLALADLDEQAEPADILDAGLTPPFLSDRRVVVVRDAGRFRGEEIDALEALFAQPLPTTTLVFVAGGGALSPKLTKRLKAVGEVIDASAPGANARRAWVADQCAERGLLVDAEAIGLLVQRLGDDAGRLTGILDTFELLTSPGDVLGVVDIEPYVRDAAVPPPWDLTDALATGSADDALRVVHQQLHHGDCHPLVILATLAKYVTNLARLEGAGDLSDTEVAKRVGMSPYPAKKLNAHARRLSPRAIRRAQRLIAEADVDLRGARAWPGDYVLDVLVARLAKLVPQGATH